MGRFLDRLLSGLGLGHGPRRLSDYEQSIIDNVREHGWFCASVLGDETSAPFTYSVGWWETAGSPELIVFGLEGKVAHAVLWNAYRALRAGDLQLTDGERVPDLVEGFDCIAMEVDPSNVVPEHFNSALWYRRHRTADDTGLRAFQLVWPGTDGLFPWEEGAEASTRDLQPPLHLPPAAGNA